jgi:hypothetical protein
MFMLLIFCTRSFRFSDSPRILADLTNLKVEPFDVPRRTADAWKETRNCERPWTTKAKVRKAKEGLLAHFGRAPAFSTQIAPLPRARNVGIQGKTPPARFAAGADAVQTFEAKGNTLLTQANAYLELSTGDSPLAGSNGPGGVRLCGA